MLQWNLASRTSEAIAFNSANHNIQCRAAVEQHVVLGDSQGPGESHPSIPEASARALVDVMAHDPQRYSCQSGCFANHVLGD